MAPQSVPDARPPRAPIFEPNRARNTPVKMLPAQTPPCPARVRFASRRRTRPSSLVPIPLIHYPPLAVIDAGSVVVCTTVDLAPLSLVPVSQHP